MTPVHYLARTLVLCILCACAPMPDRGNIEPAAAGGAYQAQYRDPVQVARDALPDLMSPAMNAARCRPAREGALAKGGGDGAWAAVRSDSEGPDRSIY